MTNPQIIIAIQARLSSTRLPGKILLPFCDIPMLAYQMQRLQRWTPYDVVALIPETDYMTIRGILPMTHSLYASLIDENDVLGRYADFARGYHLQDTDIIVRITGDCPLLCPFLLTDVLAAWNYRSGLDYYGMGPGWPDGLADIDIMTVDALRDADKKATDPLDRQHTTPWLWNHPKMYRQALYELPAELAGRRWPKFSVDTQDDFDYVHGLAQRLEHTVHTRPWNWRDVLALVSNKPALARHYEPMNAGYLEQLGATGTWEDLRYTSRGRQNHTG